MRRLGAARNISDIELPIDGLDWPTDFGRRLNFVCEVAMVEARVEQLEGEEPQLLATFRFVGKPEITPIEPEAVK